jgi:hypothetical protein
MQTYPDRSMALINITFDLTTIRRKHGFLPQALPKPTAQYGFLGGGGGSTAPCSLSNHSSNRRISVGCIDYELELVLGCHRPLLTLCLLLIARATSTRDPRT